MQDSQGNRENPAKHNKEIYTDRLWGFHGICFKIFFPKNIFRQRGILIGFYELEGGFSRNTQKQIFRRISRGNLQKARNINGIIRGNCKRRGDRLQDLLIINSDI
jgi:hypothetical protein